MGRCYSTGKWEFARAPGHDLDDGLTVRRQRAPDLELGQHDLVAARVGLLAVEDELERYAPSGDDEVWRVASGDDDRDLLGAAAQGARGHCATSSEKEDIEEENEKKAQTEGDDPVGRPGDLEAHHSLLRARRRLLVTTETEEAAIAAEAMMGESNQPVAG